MSLCRFLVAPLLMSLCCSGCVSIKGIQVDASQTTPGLQASIRLEASVFKYGNDWDRVNVSAELFVMSVSPFTAIEPINVDLQIRPGQDLSKNRLIFSLPGGRLNVETCAHSVRATVTAQMVGATDSRVEEAIVNQARFIRIRAPEFGSNEPAPTGGPHDIIVEFACRLPTPTSVTLSIPSEPQPLPDGTVPVYVGASFGPAFGILTDTVVVAPSAARSTTAQLQNVQILGTIPAGHSDLEITASGSVHGVDASTVGVLCVVGPRATDRDIALAEICARRADSVTRP